MHRPFNFSAGPATLPQDVLMQAREELLNWQGTGVSVMEMSHRSPEFLHICAQAEHSLRTLLSVPDDFHILFVQAGATAQNAMIPLNIGRAGVIDVAVTGHWSQQSYHEAQRYARQVNLACSGAGTGFTDIPAPAQWQLSGQASYLHLCSNETVHGVEFQQLPDLRALGCDTPLVIDCSSHIAARPLDWSRIGLAYAGAQKNLGPAGLSVVIVRDALLGHALPACPSAFNYRLLADSHSLYSTPPTWSIYMAGLVFDWIARQQDSGLHGLAAVEARNIRQASWLYQAIDASGLYENRVNPAVRSRMNVPFFLTDESLNDAFVSGARARGLLQLNGHKITGGMRASLYNAMTDAGVQALIQYLQDFEQQHSRQASVQQVLA